MAQAGNSTTFAESSNYGAQIGWNSGSITNTFNVTSLDSSLPSPSPSPSIVIPFRRDRDFVGRPVLDDVWQRASEPGARVGLVGLGGVGKSQIAIEYAYRCRAADPTTWVFWVHASSVARFKESYRKIAERLQLKGWDEPKADVLGMVQAWLSEENNRSWRMVVDNADSAGVIFKPWNNKTDTQIAAGSTDPSLADYLPICSHGSVVITSRSREVVEGLVEFGEDVLDVGPMEVNVAVALLRKKIKKKEWCDDTDNIVGLVRQLDCMPLAITQAAAYINQRAPRVTLSRYVEMLQNIDEERATLLQKDIRDPRRDGRASNSIIITWHVSFEYLRQTRDSAARLLALMSQFDREAIPDHLLQGRYTEKADNEPDFEDDIAMLTAYCLVNTGVSDSLFDMHRLVQYSMKTWLAVREELTWWQGRYLDILDEAFPTGDHPNWQICRVLFPHVEVTLSYRVRDVDCCTVWSRLLYRGAWYGIKSGQYSVGEKMARASLEVREEVLNQDDPKTLDSRDILGQVLGYQGKYEEAEEMNRRALAGYEKKLGVDHPDTLTSVSNLAVVLQYQGKYEEAEEMNRRALAGREKKLGMNHPDTLTSVSNLALVLGYQGKYEEAEEINRQALAGREKKLGVDHPDTLTSISNLALVLQDQGKYEEAEEMNRRALAGSEKKLGVDHPNTLASVYCLAHLLHTVQDYYEAQKLYQRAVVGYNKALGPKHPTTVACQRHQASLLEELDQPEEMDRLCRNSDASKSAKYHRNLDAVFRNFTARDDTE